MTEADLRDEMKFFLKRTVRNKNLGITINDQTIHSDVLSRSDGGGPANSANAYRWMIRFYLRENKAGANKKWPSDWLGKSVKELAAVLLA